MKIVSVNISSGDSIPLAGQLVDTGIYKKSVLTPTHVGKLGLAGDHIADLKHHGGPDQAVYLYSLEDYEWWQKQLDREIPIGTFGENLTLNSFATEAKNIKPGDRYLVGDDLIMEVTSARVPCAKLGIVMADSKFVKQFVQAQRPGIYVRVIQEGSLQQGDTIHYQATAEDYPSVIDLFNLYHCKDKDHNLIHRLLDSPMDERGKGYLREMLTS